MGGCVDRRKGRWVGGELGLLFGSLALLFFFWLVGGWGTRLLLYVFKKQLLFLSFFCPSTHPLSFVSVCVVSFSFLLLLFLFLHSTQQ